MSHDELGTGVLQSGVRTGAQPQAERSSAPASVTRLVADLERRAAEAEAMHATAPVASVLRAVVAELSALDDGNGAPVSPSVAGDDHLLDAAEVATTLKTSAKWVYRAAAAGRLPFAVHVGPKSLRFSAAGLQRWLSRRR